jgi:hypothetical protein
MSWTYERAAAELSRRSTSTPTFTQQRALTKTTGPQSTPLPGRRRTPTTSSHSGKPLITPPADWARPPSAGASARRTSRAPTTRRAAQSQNRSTPPTHLRDQQVTSLFPATTPYITITPIMVQTTTEPLSQSLRPICAKYSKVLTIHTIQVTVCGSLQLDKSVANLIPHSSHSSLQRT